MGVAGFRHILLISFILVLMVFTGGFFVLGNPDIEELRPNANGTYAEWAVNGTSENFAAVNETSADDDTTYVYTSTQNNRDAYNLTDTTIPGGSTINNVTIFIRARKAVSAGTNIQILTRTYDTDYFSANIGLSTSYANYSQNYTNNPNTSAAWTIAEINALQAGVKHVTSQTREARVTRVWVEVDYTPPPPDDLPNVTLVTPADASFDNIGNITFQCNTTDDSQLVNVTLYHNITGSWSANETVNISGTSNSTNFTINNIGDGFYVWNCEAYDNASQSAFAAANFTLTIDTANPNVSNSQSNVSVLQSSASIRINVTATDTNLDTVLVGNGTNLSMTDIGGNVFDINTTPSSLGCSEGSCILTFYANDSAGNLNGTETLQITVDDTPPAVSGQSSNVTLVKSSDAIRINVTVTDANTITEVNVSNVSNVTMTDIGGNTFEVNTIGSALGCTATDGDCILTFTATDEADNVNNTETLTITIDDVNPTVTVDFPSNNAFLSLTSINITGTASDTNPGAASDVVINDSDFGTNQGSFASWNFTNTSLVDDTYIVLITATDQVGNSGTDTVTFTIDTTNPSVSNAEVNSTTPVEVYSIVKVNASVTDTNLDIVLIEMTKPDDTKENLTTTQSGNEFFNQTVNLTQLGNYSFKFFANDTVGNINFTEQALTQNNTINLTVQDTTPPDIGNKFINESSSVNPNTTVCLNVTGISDNFQVDVVLAEVTQSNGTVFNISMSDTGNCANGAGDGVYSVDVDVGNTTGTFYYNATYVNDTSDNLNSNTTVQSLNVTEAIDNPPAVTLINPTDALFDNIGNITFQCNTTDDSQLVNVTLYHNITGSWSANETVNISGTSNSTNFTINNIGDGFYVWNCEAYDNASQSAFAAANFTLTIDTTNPNVSNSQSNVSVLQSSASIRINVTVTDTNLDTVLVGNGTNLSMTDIGGNVFDINTTPSSLGCSEGSCILTVYANDSAGNINGTTTLTITVDDTPPAVSGQSSNVSLVKSSDSIKINVTVTDSNTITEVNVSNVSNVTMTDIGGNTFEVNTTASALGCTATDLYSYR